MENEKFTLPIISKYEFTSIISERAQEIANGNPITILNPNTTNPIEIALMEYEQGKCPKKLIRTLQNGYKEIWNLNELKKF